MEGEQAKCKMDENKLVRGWLIQKNVEFQNLGFQIWLPNLQEYLHHIFQTSMVWECGHSPKSNLKTPQKRDDSGVDCLHISGCIHGVLHEVLIGFEGPNSM